MPESPSTAATPQSARLLRAERTCVETALTVEQVDELRVARPQPPRERRDGRGRLSAGHVAREETPGREQLVRLHRREDLLELRRRCARTAEPAVPCVIAYVCVSAFGRSCDEEGEKEG